MIKMNWEAVWKFLNTPPPKPTIPALERLVSNFDNFLSRWIAEQILSITELFNTFLLSTPIEILQSRAFQKVYLVMLAIAYAAILPTVAYIGIKALLGHMDGEEVLKSLGRLVIIPIGVHIGPGIVTGFMGVMNTLARLLISATPMIKASDQILSSTGLELGILIFTVAYLVLIFRLIMYYCYRNYALLFLTALFPLILLTYATGHTDKIQRWIREMTALLLTQVIHALQMVVLVAMTLFTGANSDPGIPLICVQIGALIFMNKTPQWLAEYIHDAPDPVAAVMRLKDMIDPSNFVRRVKNIVK